MNFIWGAFTGTALMFIFYPLVKNALDKLFKHNP